MSPSRGTNTFRKLNHPPHSIMQRPFVFLATDDPEFERVAIDAILESRHGVRRARDLDEACEKLRENGRDVALAVIDTTHRQFGVELLHAINGFKAGFSVLAITDEKESGKGLDDLDGLAISCLEKSIATASLRREITGRCAATPLAA